MINKKISGRVHGTFLMFMYSYCFMFMYSYCYVCSVLYIIDSKFNYVRARYQVLLGCVFPGEVWELILLQVGRCNHI